MKYRIRLGFKLSWPITNAATFVFYVNSSQKSQLDSACATVQSVLALAMPDLASRFIYNATPS